TPSFSSNHPGRAFSASACPLLSATHPDHPAFLTSFGSAPWFGPRTSDSVRHSSLTRGWAGVPPVPSADDDKLADPVALIPAEIARLSSISPRLISAKTPRNEISSLFFNN